MRVVCQSFCDIGVLSQTSKWVELVFNVKVTSEVSYFIFDGCRDTPTEGRSRGGVSDGHLRIC